MTDFSCLCIVWIGNQIASIQYGKEKSRLLKETVECYHLGSGAIKELQATEYGYMVQGIENYRFCLIEAENINFPEPSQSVIDAIK